MLNLVTNGECNIKRYKKLQNWTKGTSKSVKLIEKLSGSPPLLRGTTSAPSKIKFFNFLKYKKTFIKILRMFIQFYSKVLTDL